MAADTPLGNTPGGRASLVSSEVGRPTRRSCPAVAAASYATTNYMTSSPEAAAGTAPPPGQGEGVETSAAAPGGVFAKPLALVRSTTQFVSQHWFILGLGLFIGLAAAVPKARGDDEETRPLCALFTGGKRPLTPGNSRSVRWLRRVAPSAQSGRSSMERCVCVCERRKGRTRVDDTWQLTLFVLRPPRTPPALCACHR
jgi:hypothetical protein